MLDKNVTKYVTISDPKYTWGQKADGTWYCKEFKSDTIDDGETDIGKINKMLNKFNINKKEKSTPRTPKKEKKPDVKGLD